MPPSTNSTYFYTKVPFRQLLLSLISLIGLLYLYHHHLRNTSVTLWGTQQYQTAAAPCAASSFFTIVNFFDFLTQFTSHGIPVTGIGLTTPASTFGYFLILNQYYTIK